MIDGTGAFPGVLWTPSTQSWSLQKCSYSVPSYWSKTSAVCSYSLVGSVECGDFSMLCGIQAHRVCFMCGGTIELVNSVISNKNRSPALGLGPWAEVKEKMEV